MWTWIWSSGTATSSTVRERRRASADVGIVGDRVVAVEPALSGRAHREIEADGRVVTPGFVDIHTHLDAQLAWDPIGTSSCWHGVTSVVMGNCGVTFAPCRPEDRSYLAELMESVEDIPRDAILGGLPWDWVTYGEYLGSMGRLPKGPNVGGMVGHCAVRHHAMGERSLDDTPATEDDITAMTKLVDEAMDAGALGFSTSRTLLHTIPDGRPVPGTWATPDELFAFADVLGRHRRGVFEAASRLGERDGEDLAGTRAEMAWMGEVSRRSGRPVTFGLVQSDRRPELFRQIVGFAKEQNALGGCVRPQTTARGVGVLFGLQSRTPFDRSPAWQALHGLSLQEQLLVLRDAARRSQLIAEAEEHPPRARPRHAVRAAPRPGPLRLPAGDQPRRARRAAGRVGGRRVHRAGAGDRRRAGVQLPVPQPAPRRGRGDAGRSPGDPGSGRCRRPRRPDHGRQPAHLLPHVLDPGAGAGGGWRRPCGGSRPTRRSCSASPTAASCTPAGSRMSTSSTSRTLTLHQPEFVHDFPGGAGRYVQGSSGYDYTLVNGEVFMDHGEHTGALPGRLLRSTD